ncbi:MAG TPA: hypothetical protein GX716_07575 [Firmicutes bacterium]|jgi:hypothetical protein|nr:hypothetical protein [Candidatus Fermentithermobacillaceae bacterium]
MQKNVVITDVTRMRYGNVCIAGYTGYPSRLISVRPVSATGSIPEKWLRYESKATIRPFSKVKLDFLGKPDLTPPHTEDHVIDLSSKPSESTLLSTGARLKLLERLDDGYVKDIFGVRIIHYNGWYLKSGQGIRSLGTIEVADIEDVYYGPDFNGYRTDYRMTFSDGRASYRLAVTDLSFRYYADWLSALGYSNEMVSGRLKSFLSGASRVFLRIGLSRGWRKRPDRCYLQITGVYSFPDYLAGKCFADFR